MIIWKFAKPQDSSCDFRLMQNIYNKNIYNKNIYNKIILLLYIHSKIKFLENKIF